MQKITPNEFKVFAKYILDISGIALDVGKEYLIETRLNPILDKHNCKSFSELYTKAKLDQSKNLEKQIIDAISTNETYFFRDISPFELLQHKIIPDLIDKRTAASQGKRPIQIRIWSAASSTGQEIYSIAIVLKELALKSPQYDIKLLGTDISNDAIARASYGRYNKFEVARGLTPSRLEKYFNKDGKDYWKIKDEIRAVAGFKKINLMEPFSGVGQFDIIFCRNVAIYFTSEDKQKLYEKIAGALAPDGYLVIGSTESLSNETTLFAPQQYLKSFFYQLT
jgi:chemotaxis protein methyltransferase CheR